METILIIEDDSTMLRGLKDNFEYKGYRTITAKDGEEGLNAALNAKPDLIILDIMLPEINGYEICRLIRKENLDMPIIMLTAKGEESDVVLGLNLGADDYVTKPFSIRELLARVERFLSRRRKEQGDVFEFGRMQLDTTAMTLSRGKKRIELSPKEFSLLCYLVRNRGRALTRDQILNAVWGYDCFVNSRTVDRFVTTLRNKIEPNPHDPQYIRTMRTIGYKFDTTD
jgi:two-component system alkaline phosphatase synthesis response regulator PhoP